MPGMWHHGWAQPRYGRSFFRSLNYDGEGEHGTEPFPKYGFGFSSWFFVYRRTRSFDF